MRKDHTVNLTRRNFIKSSAAGALTLSLPSFSAKAGESLTSLAAQKPPTYTTWMDTYRKQWTWDSVSKGTHLINCWYQAHCSFDVYVKDGLVFREEQAGEYPATNPDLPDFNPRGCQKGSCYSQRMYDPSRLTFPIKRVGPRGGGKWQRVSWDDALDAIADTYIDVMVEEGTDRAIWDLSSTGISAGTSHVGQARFAALTRNITLDPNPNSGDGKRGAFETFGKFSMERSADDYFYSDLILIWGGNPIYTQIPNAHFYIEARYNGSKIITISPDYSPSAIKSDLWVPVKPGGDAALALCIANILVQEGHVNEEFVKEQTDFPLLVRSDTRKFLTEADLEKGGDKDCHIFVDETSGQMEVAPRGSLALDGQNPRLDVRQTVELHDGKTVEVRSVYSLLKERLEPYTLEYASNECGTSPKLIRRLAKEIASAKNMTNIAGSSIGKFYHGNLIERSIILIFCLLGQLGRNGAGYSAFSILHIDGHEKFIWGLRLTERASFWAFVAKRFVKSQLDGKSLEMMTRDVNHDFYHSVGKGLPIWTSGALFWQTHGGLVDKADEASKWIPDLKRPIGEHLAESLDKKWQPLTPARDRTPRIMFNYISNSLRRVRSSQKVIEHLWPKLKLVVAVDWRMTSTTQYADYVLPASAWYERFDHKWVTPLAPFHTVTTAATKPLGESKCDWEIMVLLSKHIQKRAKERGISTITAHDGEQVHLDQIYDDLTMNGRFDENAQEEVTKVLIDESSNFDDFDWQETKEKGFIKFSNTGLSATSRSNMSDFEEGKTFAPFIHHVRDKYTYPTDTRRIQFYLDHELYLEYDEALPRHKAPPTIGGDYPLIMTGGHTRWSIHGTWRDNKTLLRLQRGGPALLLSPEDAKARQIKDGDWLQVFNDVGEFKIRGKILPSVQPGSTIMYHAWENYQFPDRKDVRQVSPTPLNPVELAGGHPHLRVGFLEGQPGGFDRDTRIDVRLLSEDEVRAMKEG